MTRSGRPTPGPGAAFTCISNRNPPKYLIFIALAAFTAYVTHGTGLFVPALIVAIAAFWSNGVMANFKSDPDFAPDWATAVSFITFVASLVLLAVHYIF